MTQTTEQQAKIDRKEHASLLSAAEKKAQMWEDRYRTSIVKRSIADAAESGGAFNPSQIVTLLQDQTRLVDEDGAENVVVEMPGENEKLLLSPDEAIKRMQDQPDIYGNLFRSNVSTDVYTTTPSQTPAKDSLSNDGQIDLKSLTPEQYRKLRKENPKALGLDAI